MSGAQTMKTVQRIVSASTEARSSGCPSISLVAGRNVVGLEEPFGVVLGQQDRVAEAGAAAGSGRLGEVEDDRTCEAGEHQGQKPQRPAKLRSELPVLRDVHVPLLSN